MKVPANYSDWCALFDEIASGPKDEEYQEAVKQHKDGSIKIVSHAFALQGNLYYDKRDMPR